MVNKGGWVGKKGGGLFSVSLNAIFVGSVVIERG